jgi:hypothetical protein
MLPVPWLGEKRGYLSDWLTQLWVRSTGRGVALAEHAWLDGPCGLTSGIGADFYERLARATGLEIRPSAEGLMRSFAALAGPSFVPAAVDPRIAHFYEHTSAYRLDAWAQWCGPFRPIGWALAALFSRRLQQLNIPLSPLETSRGIRSRIVELVDPATGAVARTGWVREFPSTGRVAYVGDYSLVAAPGHDSPCVRVVFPLPNGSATVVLRPEAHPDGSLSLHSSGRRFGDPGFYFVVRRGERAAARYLPTLRERLHVYSEEGELHTDHFFSIWGIRYLQLHYRLLPLEPAAQRGGAR